MKNTLATLRADSIIMQQLVIQEYTMMQKKWKLQYMQRRSPLVKYQVH